ncbi:MAG: transcriptional regulator [Euryarchaeota archaeon]|nr:transcriptional regulator [Euryarchaeota archaeon]|tara:strand:+ start:175 stop:585 length:411 start_codon:yes stop_codon:yes gene_type:complete
MKVELVPIEALLPHEKVEEHRVDNLEKMTLRWRAYTKPLLVDRKTGTILDGHHRTKVAQRMELKCLPCVLVDYLDDDEVSLSVWPNCGRESLSKEEVIEAALSGNLLGPKTSRHMLSDHLPPISIPLERLMQPALQ